VERKFQELENKLLKAKAQGIASIVPERSQENEKEQLKRKFPGLAEMGYFG